MRAIDEVYEVMRRIAETGGLTPDMEKELESLKDEFDEREGELARYREKYDGEKASEGERKEDDRIERVEYDKLKGEYDDLKKHYRERFWGRVSDEVKEETEEDVKRDGEVQTYDELFKRREG